MSDLAIELERQRMEESGESEFIRQHVASAREDASAPAPADTADEPEDEEVDEPAAADTSDADEPDTDDDEVEETTPDGGEELPEDERDEEVEFLDVSPEVEAFVNEKYGGDLGKALEALASGQSLIGRQGNELAELRRELAERDALLQAQIQQAAQHAVPYPEFPDELTVEDDPGTAVQTYRAIAEQAFARGDADMFQRSLLEWQGLDPVGMETYATLKSIQLERSASAPAESQTPTGGDLPEALAPLVEKYPDLLKPETIEAINQEASRWPTLGRLLQSDATLAERTAALEELYLLTARRMTSDTEQKARKKVALRVSEEARRVRQEATVATATRGRERKSPDESKRVAPIGETGRTFDFDRLNAMLPPEDRV